MSYKVVQKQSNGRYYLYEVTGAWDPVKKNSKQIRTYLGVCDAEGNLLKEATRNRTVSCSPVYGPYQLFVQLAERSGLTSALDDVYGMRDGRRLLAMAILGIVDPVTVNQMENTIDDTYLRELLVSIGISSSRRSAGSCRQWVTLRSRGGSCSENSPRRADASSSI